MKSNYKICLLLSLLIMALVSGAVAQNVPALSTTSPTGTVLSPTPTVPAISAMGSDYNYVRTFIPRQPTSVPESLTLSSPSSSTAISTTYTDGFERAMETLEHNFSEGKTLVSFADTRFKTENIGYLPYVTTGNYFKVNPFSEQQGYYATSQPGEGFTAYQKETNNSSSTTREARVFSSGKSQVGQNRGTTTKLITNDANQVRAWRLNATGQPISYGFYGINELIGEETTDVNGGKTRVFKEKQGMIVYKAILLEGSTWAINNYVYDEKANLVFDIMPKAVASLAASGTVTLSATLVNNFCFEYKYDAKNRVAQHKKPGETGFLSIVYDRKDRVIMRQSQLESTLGKWEVCFYDNNNRVIATSLIASTSTRDYWQGQIDATLPTAALAASNLLYYLATDVGEGVYPAAISGNEMMSYNFYDHYAHTSLAGVFLDGFSAAEFTESPLGAEPSVRSSITFNKLTGCKIRVVKPTGSGTELGDWIETVNYYDKKGRLLQKRSRNATKSGSAAGKEIVSNYYDYTNKLLLTIHGHENKKTGHAATEYTKFTYNANNGRLLNTAHKVNNDVWNLINIMEYDDLGRVRRKVLGNYGEVQDYSYNIRGQLTGINNVYAETGNKGGESRSFGASLKYDYGFTAPRYDGQIAGMVWRGSGGNSMAYGYDYDLSGRLKKADFRKWEAGTSAWSNTLTDYSVSNLAYDENGNLTGMKQRGMGIPSGSSVVSPVDMDRLNYVYETNSNRLARVEDTVTFNYNLGDFVNGNVNTTDYTYDNSGNLTKDLNKGISSITYTYFNKPEVITFSNGNIIKYIYDASGSKLQELVTVSGTSKRTDYIGNFVYEGDVLKYIATSEGRATYNPGDGKYKEEFFVKDHIGNVRSTVDVKNYVMTEYLATYEVASAALEGLMFDKVSEIAEENPLPNPGNMQSGLLNGSIASKRIGTSLLLRVMAGDRVELNVNSYYEGYSPGTDAPVSTTTMLSSIVSTLTAGAGGLGGSESHNPQLVGQMFNSNNFSQFANIVNNSTATNRPKAYLNYVLFSENMQIVGSFSGAYQADGSYTWGGIGTDVPMEIPQNGYLAVYLSNASTINVHFDLLTIRLTKGRLLEENHYYPHGLPMGNIGSSASGFAVNRVRHQSNEQIKDAGLHWMDFDFRQYDPQIARFLSVDPFAGEVDVMSAYTAMNNNPISMVDPYGLKPFYHSSNPNTPEPTFTDMLMMMPPSVVLDMINGYGPSNPFGETPSGAAGLQAIGSVGAPQLSIYGMLALAKHYQGSTVYFISGRLAGVNRRPYEFLGIDNLGNNLWLINESGNISYQNPKDDVIALLNESESVKRPDDDGYLTYDESVNWYRTGNGQPLNVDLGKISINGLYTSSFRGEGSKASVNLIMKTSPLNMTMNTKVWNDAKVYGSLTFRLYGNNQVRAFTDNYDFEMHPWYNPLNWARNFATIYGDPGPGTPYEINFYGSLRIPSQPLPVK